MQDRLPQMRKSWRALLSDERGTTAIEYVIIASLVSIVIIGTATSLGTALHDTFYEKAAKAFEE